MSESIFNCSHMSLLESIRTYVASEIASPGPPKSQEATAATIPSGPHLPLLSHFPALNGPMEVGSLDVEMASGPFVMGDDKDPQMFFEKPSTILFRMFYPTDELSSKPVYWVPEPYQFEYLQAYESFAGTGGIRNFLLSLFPRQVTNIKVHATEAAPPTEIEPRSPLIIMSHSLGGSRHSYTYIATYLASHGCYVVCPEHRDGSAALSMVRDKLGNPPDETESWVSWEPAPSRIRHIKLEDSFTKPVEAARLKQMAIRCWELQILFRALCKINSGDEIRDYEVHVGSEMRSMSLNFLQEFKGRMESLNTPGEVIWLGHGYGAATIIQLHKSTFYPVPPALTDHSMVIFAQPPVSCPLRRQITDQSTMILLDPWVFPLAFKQVRYLFRLRLPQMNASDGTPRSLCMLSDQFYAWKEAMLCLRRVFNRNPMMCPLPLRQHKNTPLWYYIEKSGHGNFSDFGLLFNHHPHLDGDMTPSDPKWIMDVICKCILEYMKKELQLRDIPVGETEIIGNLLTASDIDRPWRWVSIKGDEWDATEWDAIGPGLGQTIGIEDSWFCNFAISTSEADEFLLPRHRDYIDYDKRPKFALEMSKSTPKVTATSPADRPLELLPAAPIPEPEVEEPVEEYDASVQTPVSIMSTPEDKPKQAFPNSTRSPTFITAQKPTILSQTLAGNVYDIGKKDSTGQVNPEDTHQSAQNKRSINVQRPTASARTLIKEALPAKAAEFPRLGSSKPSPVSRISSALVEAVDLKDPVDSTNDFIPTLRKPNKSVKSVEMTKPVERRILLEALKPGLQRRDTEPRKLVTPYEPLRPAEPRRLSTPKVHVFAEQPMSIKLRDESEISMPATLTEPPSPIEPEHPPGIDKSSPLSTWSGTPNQLSPTILQMPGGLLCGKRTLFNTPRPAEPKHSSETDRRPLSINPGAPVCSSPRMPGGIPELEGPLFDSYFPPDANGQLEVIHTPSDRGPRRTSSFTTHPRPFRMNTSLASALPRRPSSLRNSIPITQCSDIHVNASVTSASTRPPIANTNRGFKNLWGLWKPRVPLPHPESKVRTVRDVGLMRSDSARSSRSKTDNVTQSDGKLKEPEYFLVPGVCQRRQVIEPM